MPGLIPVQFFYGIGSRYSYLASTRIAQLEAETGCRARWRPLYSGELFRARGGDPFAGAQVSGQYHWSYRRFDAECWSDCYGVPYREPEGLILDPAARALAARPPPRHNRQAGRSDRRTLSVSAPSDRGLAGGTG